MCIARLGEHSMSAGSTAKVDLLTVYAEAFERDADPEDFSLTAMLAHERGHQILGVQLCIAKRVSGRISAASEEILASLLGALLCTVEGDGDALIAKAILELLEHGEPLTWRPVSCENYGIFGVPLL